MKARQKGIKTQTDVQCVHLEVKEVTKNDKRLEKDKNIGEKKRRAMGYIRKKMSTQVCNSRYKCVKEKIIAKAGKRAKLRDLIK